MARSPATVPRNGGPNRLEKLQVGRPSKLTPTLMAKAKVIVPKMMGEGAFLEEIIAELDVSRDTISAWCANNQEFSDIIAKGRRLFEAWWIKNGREGVASNNFNSNQYKWMTMNGMQWSQNVKSETKVDISDIVQSAAAARLKKVEEEEGLIEHE